MISNDRALSTAGESEISTQAKAENNGLDIFAFVLHKANEERTIRLRRRCSG